MWVKMVIETGRAPRAWEWDLEDDMGNPIEPRDVSHRIVDFGYAYGLTPESPEFGVEA
jgi:hypothetical protein